MIITFTVIFKSCDVMIWEVNRNISEFPTISSDGAASMKRGIVYSHSDRLIVNMPNIQPLFLSQCLHWNDFQPCFRNCHGLETWLDRLLNMWLSITISWVCQRYWLKVVLVPVHMLWLLLVVINLKEKKEVV